MSDEPKRRNRRPRVPDQTSIVEFKAPEGTLMEVDLASDAPIEAKRIAPGQEELEFRISARAEEGIRSLPTDSALRQLPEAKLLRIVSWHATPFEWRWPKTDAELALELELPLLRLRVAASMLAGAVENSRAEIRRAATEHAQLRTLEALDGMVFAANQGNAPAFDRVMKVGWNETVTAPAVTVMPQPGAVTSGNIRPRLLEKLGL